MPTDVGLLFEAHYRSSYPFAHERGRLEADGAMTVALLGQSDLSFLLQQGDSPHVLLDAGHQRTRGPNAPRGPSASYMYLVAVITTV